MRSLGTGLLVAAVVTALWASAARAETSRLRSGALLDLERDMAMPREIVTLAFLGGPSRLSREDQAVVGVLANVLKEGPAGVSLADYRRKLFMLNASIGFSTAVNATYLVVTAPPEKLSEALELARAMIMAPKFDDKTFERARSIYLTNVTNHFNDMSAVIGFYAARDALGSPPELFDGGATPSQARAVTLDGTRQGLARLLNFEDMLVMASGPLEARTVKTLLEQRFFAGLGKLPKLRHVRYKRLSAAPFKRKGFKVTLIHRAGATDNQIQYLLPVDLRPATIDTNYDRVLADILGGGLQGRLPDTLRTKRGLTYSVGMSGRSGYQPFWVIRTFGGIEQMLGLLKGVPEVVEKFKDEIVSASEIAESVERHTMHFKVGTELAADRLARRMGYRVYDWDMSYLDRYIPYFKRVTGGGLKSFAATKLSIDGGYLYLMGDKDKLLPILEKAGFAAEAVRVVNEAEIL